jgi:pyruvate kinase
MKREYKTKIVATVGPACRDTETLRRMVEAGMDAARLTPPMPTTPSSGRRSGR